MNVCCSCGRDDVELFDVGSVNKFVRACAACIAKHGREQLKDVADQALAWILDPRNRDDGRALRCGHCPNPVVRLANGSVPVLCSECQRKLNALRESA
jgi:class 3 adenylate cyclase